MKFAVHPVAGTLISNYVAFHNILSWHTHCKLFTPCASSIRNTLSTLLSTKHSPFHLLYILTSCNRTHAGSIECDVGRGRSAIRHGPRDGRGALIHIYWPIDLCTLLLTYYRINLCTILLTKIMNQHTISSAISILTYPSHTPLIPHSTSLSITTPLSPRTQPLYQ